MHHDEKCESCEQNQPKLRDVVTYYAPILDAEHGSTDTGSHIVYSSKYFYRFSDVRSVSMRVCSKCIRTSIAFSIISILVYIAVLLCVLWGGTVLLPIAHNGYAAVGLVVLMLIGLGMLGGAEGFSDGLRLFPKETASEIAKDEVPKKLDVDKNKFLFWSDKEYLSILKNR